MNAMPERGALDDPQRPHAIVIGAGIGGLAAAIRLGARGWRVSVLERCEQAGGRAAVFRQDGFTFDAGPTIITAPFLLEELWTLAGRRFADDVTLVPIDPFYRIRFDTGSYIDCSADPAFMRAEIQRLAPGDLAGYERFIALTERIYQIGFEQLGHVPFGSWTDMARILPDLLRLSGHRSVYALAARHVRDERIRAALSFHPLLVGGNPFKVSAIYAMILHLERAHGVHFAMGGTGRIVEGMAGLIAGQGGSIRLNTNIDRITIADGAATGVALDDGTRIAADIVVSNACTAHTYRHLLRDAPRRRWTDRKLKATRYSMGLFVWYFGTDIKFPDVPHHAIIMGPRYRGLLDDIFEHKTLATDMSIYLHRPTATDPSLAPPGCDGFYALAPVPHLGGDIDWATQAEPYRQALERRLAETMLPGLAGHVVTSRIMTPADFESRYASTLGAGFGMEPVLTQSAWFRPHNASEELRNLFLVGAGTHPGAGVPGVLSTARVLDGLVPAVSTVMSSAAGREVGQHV
ncbi:MULTISPECIES: phytoene desaturase family protein [Acidiphilium]|uniref:Phytoene dehydrogenase n=2 Tax=Acidiphilium rubrum TaxID=526 RepID=A0A8G2CI04_ACIRU|nr:MULTISPECIES: phytoene desaturase family protein [Acidiphilium]SIQ16898.1 phytoene desaturase [Acidiphilium rubrum]